MKIRNGFVSNSSSSSFIIAYGMIKDRKKLDDYLKKNGITYEESISRWSEVRIVPYVEINQSNRNLSCTNCISLDIPIGLDKFKNKEFIIVELGNNEGDSFFWEDDSYECNWDKAEDIDFWSGSQRALIELFSEDQIIDEKCCDIIFGAERNG